MCPSHLPTVSSEEEEHISTHYPNGMLDRDQRTAYTIQRIQKSLTDTISIPLSQLIHKSNTQPSSSALSQQQHNHHHQNCSERCKWKRQIRDNTKTVMCLSTKYGRLVGFNRSRTKFCASIHIFIWIWIFAVCPTYSMPISKCEQEVRSALEHCQQQTEHSIQNLNSTIDVFRAASNLSKQTWGHFIQEIDTSNIKTLFSEKTATKEELKSEFKFITDHLHNVSKAFNYILYMHRNESQKTELIFDHKKYNNSIIIDFFKENQHNAILNILHINDTSRELGLDLALPDLTEIGYTWDHDDLIIFEFLRVEQYSKILQYMEQFFEHALKTSQMIKYVC